jgi:hypothetical protein
MSTDVNSTLTLIRIYIILKAMIMRIPSILIKNVPVLLAIVSVTVILSCGGGGGGGGNGGGNDGPPVAPDPPVADALQGLQLFEGWTDPRKLSGAMNTAGWEDSAFISYDGTRLYFGYSPLDYYEFTQGNAVTVGPTGPPERPDQHGDSFDIYEARIQGGSWAIENSSANSTDPLLHEAAIGVDNDESTMAFVQFDPEGDIYLTEKKADGTWDTPVAPPSPINTPCVEDNPHLSGDGLKLYFDSNRDDIDGITCLDESGGNQRSIYVSTNSGGTWSTPEKIQGAPESHVDSWQVFVDESGTYLYWSGACPGGACLFRARKLAGGSYGEETVIAQTSFAAPSPGDVIAVGEMSITGDGRFLYFVYMQYNSATDIELGLAVARKP